MMQAIKKSFTRQLPFFLSVPTFIWQSLFLYMPLLIIFYFSIVDAQGFFTLSAYRALLDVPFFKILLRSFFLALFTATSTLVLAYPVVYYLVFHLRNLSRYLLVLLMIPFWVNFLMLAYSWFFLLEHNGLINRLLLWLGVIHSPLTLVYNVGAIVVVMVYCYLPFMIMPLYNSLEKLDQRLLEASADLGANAWQTFTRVTLPLSAPGIKTGFLLVFVPAFGEFAIPTLLGGSKFLVVGSLISYYFFVARNNSLGAAFTVCAGLFLLLSVLLLQKGSSIYKFFTAEKKL